MTVDYEPFVNDSAPLPTFVTDEEGYLTEEAGTASFLHDRVALSISHPAHELEDTVLPMSLGESALDEGVYEVFLDPGDDAPRAIVCVDEQDLPIAGVVVRAFLPDRRFHIREVYVGTTDDAGRLTLPGWTNQARLLIFGGSVCPASIAPRDDCEVYRLRRSCVVELQVVDWRPGMAVEWNFEVADYRPGSCEADTEIDPFIDRGEGRFEAKLPRGLPVRLLCRDKALREWEGRVTAQSPRERIEIELAPSSLTRRLTLVPEGGVIEAVRVTTFRDVRLLSEMPVALVQDAGEVSLLVPTDPCQVFVQAASGEVAILREGAGAEDARVSVAFRGTRSVKFVVVDVEGRPIPDVLVHVREKQGTLATGAVLPRLQVQQIEDMRSSFGWMQKVYTGGNQRSVARRKILRAVARRSVRSGGPHAALAWERPSLVPPP